MSIKCQKLARNVNCFKGTVREVYKCIADHASKGATHNKGDKKKKHLPEDWTSIGYARMMMECNALRKQTITNVLRELAGAGAIEIKEVSGRRMFRFDTPWAEAHQWTDADLESFRCLASERYANRMLEKSQSQDYQEESGLNLIKPEESLTTENVVSHNGERCEGTDLQRNPLALTTENRPVTHLTELTALQKIVSHHTGVNSQTSSGINNLSVSQEQLEPDQLTPEEEMMKIWAETHKFWSKFTHSDKTFRSGCLGSDAFRKQYQKFRKLKLVAKAVPVPVEDDYDLSADFGEKS